MYCLATILGFLQASSQNSELVPWIVMGPSITNYWYFPCTWCSSYFKIPYRLMLSTKVSWPVDKAFIQEAFGGTMPPIIISHPSSSYVQPKTEPSGEWYGSKDLCIPGSLCRSSINLKSSWARVRSYGEIRHDDSPGSMYWDDRTVMLSFSLCSFSLFGMTTVFLCTPQLRMTWAGVALYFIAISLTPSCSKKVDERPRNFLH